MNSTEYAFNTDVAEKKRIARGAYSKKTHNGKGGCRLPHEDLTEAQRRALNGPVATYNLDKPMLWKEFRAMPEDLQKSYLRGLQKKYGARDTMLGKMLCADTSTICYTRKALGVPALGGRASRDEQTAWDAWIAADSHIAEARAAQKAADDKKTEILGLTLDLAAKAQEKPAEAPPTTVVADPEGPRVSTTVPSVTWEDLIATTKILGARYGVRIRIEVDT
jgi:hypothetical protein